MQCDPCSSLQIIKGLTIITHPLSCYYYYSSWVYRRSLEVANRFCSTHHIDASTQTKISHYFKYMSDGSMNNCVEQGDLALLPEHLRCEFVLQKVWKSIKKISFLDTQLYDKVSE